MGVDLNKIRDIKQDFLKRQVIYVTNQDSPFDFF